MKTEFYLARGIIEFNRKYLLIRREKSDVAYESEKWEIPGGRISKGESPEQALLREIQEETGLNVEIVKELPTLEGETEEVKSKCYVFYLKASFGDVKLDKSHINYEWINPEDFRNYDLALFADLLKVYFDEPEKYLK